MPIPTCRLLLNGEIVSARDFEYDGLFVHYFVELPMGWNATTESQLIGMTQRYKKSFTEFILVYFYA